jgi:Cu2+-exporting ATPase
MELTLKVSGLMCPKCENRARKALEAVAGVEKALVSHTEGTAVVTGEALDPAALKAAVEEAGYTVVG